MSKQPDKELRQAIEIIFASNEMSGAWPDATNDLIDLFTKAQLQLVDELMEQLPDKRVGTEKMPLNDIERGYNVCVEDAISVLQQYKANLSGGTE